MYLFLNTSSAERIDFLFASTKKILCSKQLEQYRGKRVDVLRELAKILKKLKKTPKSIKGIIVVVGPGYFSHLRTGIAIANAFCFANATPLKGIHVDQFPKDFGEIEILIKLVGSKSSGAFLAPEYGKEPTITLKKKR